MLPRTPCRRPAASPGQGRVSMAFVLSRRDPKTCAIGAADSGPSPLWSVRLATWTLLALAALAYLLLLARSAWKQGEFRQFLWSLAIVAAIVGVIAAAVWIAAALGR